MNGKDCFFSNTLSIVKNARIIPIIEVAYVDQIDTLLKLYHDAGFRTLEVKMNSAHSKQIIRKIQNLYPDTYILAGTCRSIEDIQNAQAMGVDIYVSPEFNEELITFCCLHNIPYIPSIDSEENLSIALSLGYAVIKFYHAENAGGIVFLRKTHIKYDIEFMASGGLTIDKIKSYCLEPNLAACCTSHISSIELLENNNWNKIINNINEVRNLLTEK